MKLNKKYIFLFLFIILSSQGFAQKRYVKGYVITEERDTLHGTLKVMTPENSCAKLRFKDKYGRKVKFVYEDVYAYKRGDEMYYKKHFVRPIAFNSSEGYMKLIKKGKVKLLAYNYEFQYGGTMDISGFMYDTGDGFHKDYYLQRYSRAYLVTRKQFIDTMSQYFADDLELVKKIQNKELTYDDIETIVELYNK